MFGEVLAGGTLTAPHWLALTLVQSGLCRFADAAPAPAPAAAPSAARKRAAVRGAA